MAIIASLDSITCPGSLGIISASLNKHPFEMAQRYYDLLIFHRKTKNLYRIKIDNNRGHINTLFELLKTLHTYLKYQ